MKWLVLLAAVLHEALAPSVASAAAPARIAVFDFELIDTSLQGEVQGIDPADQARLRMIERSCASASRNPAASSWSTPRPSPSRSTRPASCGAATAARSASPSGSDAELALVGWVQKVSNLMLNFNVAIRDTATREQVFAGSVDIRGNTDESWRHGIRYLLKNRLLKE